MPKQQQYDVFISHSRKDSGIVKEVARALIGSGLDVWLDEWSLIPGQAWQEALEEAISKSGVAAIFIGPNGLPRAQEAEVREVLRGGAVSERRGRIIPILLPDSTPDSIPEQLRSLAWIDLRGGLEDKKGFTKLLSAVTKPHEEGELAQQEGMGDRMMAAGDANQAVEHYQKALEFAQAKGDQRTSLLLMLRLGG